MEWLLKTTFRMRVSVKQKMLNGEIYVNFRHLSGKIWMNRSIPLAYSTVAKKHRASMEVLTGSLEDTKAVGEFVGCRVRHDV